MAKAIQAAFGGEVIVLTRPNGVADHAAVEIGDRLVDWDGPSPPGRFISRFNRREMASTIAYRAIRAEDLSEAPLQNSLVAQLATCIRLNDPRRQ